MNRIEIEIDIAASKEKLWSAWTRSENVSEWFAPLANIEPMVGGAFELFFIPSDPNHMTTKGCSFLELIPNERLSFNWKGPDDYAELMNHDPLTVVTVTFKDEQGTTKITLSHTGFATGSEWDDSIKWHQLAWTQVLNSLKEFSESNVGNICCK